MEDRSLEQLIARHKDDPWQIFLSVPHLASFFMRSIRSVAALTLSFLLVVIWVGGGSQATYTANATFQDSPEASDEFLASSAGLTHEKRDGEGGEENSPIVAMLLSGKVLGPVIEELGLQAHCVPVETTLFAFTSDFLERRFRTIVENYRIDLAHLMGRATLERVDDRNHLTIRQVRFSGTEPTKFWIHLIDEASYKLMTRDGKYIATGQFDEPLVTKRLTLTVHAPPHTVRHPIHRLVITPKTLAISTLRDRLRIRRDRGSSEIIHLAYTDSVAQRSAQVLNRVMESYIEVRQAELDQKMKEKLTYLEQRKVEVATSLEELINAGRKNAQLLLAGGLDYERQAEQLAEMRRSLVERRSILDLQLASLRTFVTNDYTVTARAYEELPHLEGALRRLQKLKEKRDALAMYIHPDENRLTPHHVLTKNKARVDSRLRDLQALSASLAARASGKSAIDDPILPFLKSMERKTRLSSEVLDERILYPVAEELELEGLTLDGAEELYDELSARQTERSKESKTVRAAIGHLQDPTFAVASLSEHLNDAVSQELIRHAAELAERVNNPTLYSNRELRYFSDFLERKKEVLSAHLTQKLRLLDSEQDATQNQLVTLRHYMVSEMNHEVAVIEELVKEETRDKLSSVELEREEVKRQLSEVEKEQRKLPELKAAEQAWEMRKELSNQVTTALTEMVEAVTLTQNLQKVTAHPLDRAVAPLLPNRSHLLSSTLFGTLWALLFSLATLMAFEAIGGFHVTPTTLRLAGAHVMGEIPERTMEMPASEREQDLLRKLLRYQRKPMEVDGKLVKPPHRLLVLSGETTPRTGHLAQLLSRHGQRVLLIDTPIYTPDDHDTGHGLLDYLKGDREEPPIHCRSGYDQIYSGGTSPDCSDLLESKKFAGFLDQFKDYDWILIGHGGDLSSASSHALLNVTYRVLVQVQNERYRTLMSYLPQDENRNKRVSFIFCT